MMALYKIKIDTISIMRYLVVVLALVSFGNALPNRSKGEWQKRLIVGGRPATQGEVPYQLRMKFHEEQHCGASLIVVDGVTLGITAAHCIPSGLPTGAFTVIAGDLSIGNESGIEQARPVIKIVNHEGYEFLTKKNDISLLFIDEPFQFNQNVQPIALPVAGDHTYGDLFVSGWGRLVRGGATPDVLQVVEVPVVDDEACQVAYDDLGDEIFETFICAGLLGVGGKDACQGDSGGPARSIDGNYLAGVVSWGEGCAEPNYPGVYIEVSHYVDWIHDQVAAYKLEDNKNIPA